MSIIRLKSAHPETEYAPTWNIPLYQSTWGDEGIIDSIRNWLIDNEQLFLELPINHDGDTDLGEESVTSRFGSYNLFNYTDKCPSLNDLLTFLRASYIDFVRSDQTSLRDLDIVCWFNLLRKGEKIKEHNHGAGHDVYLSGNLHLDNYNTETYYVSPYDKNRKYPFKNEKGGLTLFPTYLVHGATEFGENDLRLSIAFDLRLAYNTSNINLNAIPFMNREIFESL